MVAKLVGEALESVPLGRVARTKQLGAFHGNPVLDGYDCVIVSCSDQPWDIAD